MNTSGIDAEYRRRVAQLQLSLGQWHGARTAAARYVAARPSDVTRWLALRTIMSGERLVMLERFCRMPQVEQRAFLTNEP